MLTKRHAKRFQNMIRVLREVKDPTDFTMKRYTFTCGAPACCLGHYAARRDVQQTFKLTPRGNFAQASNRRSLRHDAAIVQDHFGIRGGEASHLFSATGCGGALTTTDAANYIEKFLKEKLHAPR